MLLISTAMKIACEVVVYNFVNYTNFHSKGYQSIKVLVKLWIFSNSRSDTDNDKPQGLALLVGGGRIRNDMTKI